MSLYFCWQGGMVHHGHTKKNSHVQPVGHGRDTTWELPSEPDMTPPTTSVDITEHCSAHPLPAWREWLRDSLSAYSSRSPTTTVVPQLILTLFPLTLCMLLTHLSQGAKLPWISCSVKQGKGGASRWGLVDWITPLEGFVLPSLAPEATLPEGNSAACLKPDGMSLNFRSEQPPILCSPSIGKGGTAKEKLLWCHTHPHRPHSSKHREVWQICCSSQIQAGIFCPLFWCRICGTQKTAPQTPPGSLAKPSEKYSSLSGEEYLYKTQQLQSRKLFPGELMCF